MPGTHDATVAGSGSRRDGIRVAVGVVALLLVGLAAYRATLGISFVDDAHYAAVTLRLAQGARPFADEMTTQALGFLIAAPFARLWTALFGMSGIVLALRLFYVALASCGGWIVYRAVRPSFGVPASALAAAVPLLAPPYNVFGASYNTVSALGFTLAVALAIAAVRDDSRRTAALTGVAAAVAAISYPPLAVAALVLAATFALVARDKRLTLAALAGAGATVAVFGVWLLATVPVADIRNSLQYASDVWGGYTSPQSRLLQLLDHFRRGVISKRLLPAWGLAAAASLSWIPRRLRSVAALLLPLACAVPGALALVTGSDKPVLGTNGAAYLIVFTSLALVPVAVHAFRQRDEDLRRALLLAVPMSAIGYVIVGNATSSGWPWGVAVVGMTPLVAVVAAGWARLVKDGADIRWVAAGAATLAGLLLVLLFATSFKDEPPLSLTHRFDSGALAGIATTPMRAADIARIEEAGRRWIGDGDRVLVVGRPLGYLVLPGRITTNAAWLVVGPSDRYTVEYFERTGELPDVAFINRSLIEIPGGIEAAATGDPLIAYLADGYTLVETFDPFAVFTRN